LVKFDFLTLIPVEKWFPRSCFRHNAHRLIKPLRVSKQYTVGAGFKPGEIGKVVSGGESGVKIFGMSLVTCFAIYAADIFYKNETGCQKNAE